MKKSLYIKIQKGILFSILILTGFVFSCKKSPVTPTTVEVPTISMGYKVSIQNSKFSPESLTIPVNSTVIWTNNDDMPHNVVSETGSFDSGNLSGGNTYSHQFTNGGTFTYKCTLHSNMSGTIIVR
jgi:plastocyanin